MQEATFDHLIAKQMAATVPFSVGFEMTSRCNEDCTHCVRSRWMDHELTYDEIVDILHQLADEGAMELTYTGGEPLVRRDCLPILQKSRELGFALFLFTNATLITRETAQALAECRVQEVDVSVYGVTPDVHDGITRVKGSLQRTMRGIEYLEEAGIPVNVKMALMRQNFHELHVLKALCETRRWNFRFDYILFPRDDGSTDVWDDRISEDQIRIADRMQKDDERRTDLIRSDEIGMADEPMPALSVKKGVCSAGWNTVSITAQGEVLPCITWRMSLGNLRRQSFREIWRHAPLIERIRALTHRNFDAPCASCGLISKCHKCPGLAYSEHRDPFLPSSDRCRATQAINILEDNNGTAKTPG